MLFDVMLFCCYVLTRPIDVNTACYFIFFNYKLYFFPCFLLILIRLSFRIILKKKKDDGVREEKKDRSTFAVVCTNTYSVNNK